MNMAVFQEFPEHLRSQEHIGHGPVAVWRKRDTETLAERIEVVPGGRGEEAFAEEHGAEARRQVHISPATLLFDIEETPVECRIVCDEDGVFRKSKECGKNGHDGGRVAQSIVRDAVDPLGVRRDRAFGIHQ